jgi:hypothetical protein
VTAPVFATRWQFVFAWVLVGVDRRSGAFSGGRDDSGRDVVHVWTSDEAAASALPEDVFAIQQLTVRDLLSLLPPGTGVVVDPGSASGLAVDADMVADLKRYVHPFPGGTVLECTVWHDLPDAVRDAVVQQVSSRPFIEEVRAFLYTIDDSPYLGCLAYSTSAGPEGQDTALGAIEAALPGDLAALDVASVSVVSLVDVPDEVRRALPPETLIHPAPAS